MDELAWLVLLGHLGIAGLQLPFSCANREGLRQALLFAKDFRLLAQLNSNCTSLSLPTPCQTPP